MDGSKNGSKLNKNGWMDWEGGWIKDWMTERVGG